MKKLLFYSFVLFLFSCKKNQLGGSSVITGTVVHHTRFIANAKVYIKFNAKEFPGTDITKYDTSVQADASGDYKIKCYKGDYFLYGVGYDDQLQLPVSGGIPVHIRNNETLAKQIGVTE